MRVVIRTALSSRSWGTLNRRNDLNTAIVEELQALNRGYSRINASMLEELRALHRECDDSSAALLKEFRAINRSRHSRRHSYALQTQQLTTV